MLERDESIIDFSRYQQNPARCPS